MKYPLFLSDFDGTLVRADGTVSETNIRAIEKYRKAGGIFAVVTGRMLSAILPRLSELGLKDGLVVAYQGAMIADVSTGALLRSVSFPWEKALPVVRFMEEAGLHVHIYLGDELFANRRDGFLDAYEKICGVRGETEDLCALIQRRKEGVVKILAMTMPEDQARVFKMLNDKFGEECFVTLSSEWLVEIMPKGVDKASAVSFLCERFGIPAERTAAIGDQLNDLPLLRAAGGRFAVANAVPALKEKAVVVPSCEEDGVAYVIEHFLLSSFGGKS